jgi:hypothetical protein
MFCLSPHPGSGRRASGLVCVRGQGEAFRQEGQGGPHSFPASTVRSQCSRNLALLWPSLSQHWSQGPQIPTPCSSQKEFSWEMSQKRLHCTLPRGEVTGPHLNFSIRRDHSVSLFGIQNTNTVNHKVNVIKSPQNSRCFRITPLMLSKVKCQT